MKEIFAICALVVSVAANIPYIYETIKGEVKPHRISWLLWTILGGTYYFSAVFSDGAVLFTFGELVGPITLLLLSLKFGVGGKNRFDVYSLIVALVALGLLFVFEGVIISLILALIVDGIGVTLTIRKLLLDPDSESRGFWGLAFISSIFAALSLSVYTPETLLFPVYVFLISAFIFIKIKPQHENNLSK